MTTRPDTHTKRTVTLQDMPQDPRSLRPLLYATTTSAVLVGCCIAWLAGVLPL